MSVAADVPEGSRLEVRNIGKTFPGVVALDDVSLQLIPGTVHGLIGENGAGKSTLMKIIAGIYTPDAGELSLRGHTLRLRSPRDALQNGIAMIHQELNLMPSMSVAENIWIGREPVNACGVISHRQLRCRTHALLERLAIDIDPEAEVRTLSIAARQMVEIAKALSHESRLLIMDEPTSALTERDAEHLFTVIRQLTAQGTGIFYITHRMDELFEITNEISVFRDGRHIGTDRPENLSRDAIIHMMVGRELARIFPREPASLGPVLLSVRDLTLEHRFRDISFELHAGEILGVAGLIGAGRSDLAQALFGLSPATSGRVWIERREVKLDSPQAAMSRGMAFVTEDRKESGCFLSLSLLENLEISVLNRDFIRLGFVRNGALTRACTAMSGSLRVKTLDLHERIENLSGGNQQKVLLGRWLLMNPKILILDEPTRGVDVAAKAEIHQLIVRLVAQGAAVLMISSELPEILGMSHRIMVMHEGRVTGILNREEADQVKIMGARRAISARRPGQACRAQVPAAPSGCWLPGGICAGVSLRFAVRVTALAFEILGWIFVWQSFLLNEQRLIVMILQVSVIGIIAVGVTQVIITGGIDLSSGSVVAVTAMVAASLAQSSDAVRAVYPGLTDLPLVVPIAAGLAVGALAGLLNGTLIA